MSPAYSGIRQGSQIKTREEIAKGLAQSQAELAIKEEIARLKASETEQRMSKRNLERLVIESQFDAVFASN